MTYPQPDSVAPVLGGEDMFRLLVDVRSGDIYESEVSALAFVLGPNGDIATVGLTYYNPNADNLVTKATISPDRSLVARIDARMDAQYPTPGKRKGRILISVEDVYNTRWRPTGFDGNDVIAFEVPVLDVLQYFTQPPSVVPQRSDRFFDYQYFAVPLANPNSTWVVMPSFSRKSGFFTFTNLDAAQIVTATVWGINTSISEAPGPVGTFQKSLSSAAVAAVGGTHTYAWRSSVDGSWDMIAFELSNYRGAAMPVTVSLSDDVE